MTDKEWAEKIHGLKAAYALLSPLTRMPYVECEEENYYDCAVLFEARGDADAAVKAYAQEGIQVVVQELKTVDTKVTDKSQAGAGGQKKIQINQVQQHLGNLPMLGVNALVFRPADGAPVVVELSALFPKEFLDKMKDSPFYQPNLQLLSLYFMQELRRKKEAVEQGRLRAMDEEFCANLAKSRLIAAVIPPADYKQGQQIKIAQSQIPMIKNPQGEAYIPVFTDIWEFQRFALQNSKLCPILMELGNLRELQNAEAKAFLLNPLGVAFPITSEMISKIKEYFG